MVETLALTKRPVDELDGAVDGRAFLVAGQEEADRAGERSPRDEAQGGGDRGGDAALHVAGAAAPEFAVGDLGRERVEPPARLVARRHDVGVAGEGEIGPRVSEPRIEVEDRGRSLGLEGDEVGGEPGLAQKIAQIGQRAGVDRRDRGKAEKRARDLERRGRSGHDEACRAATSAAFHARAPPSRGRRRRSAARCWTEDSIDLCWGCASGT